MAAEYRAKYPGKPVICDFPEADWAWLCAGGSMPNLPRSTDEKLLTAIPRMQLWLADGKQHFWALREAGKQVLAYGMGGNQLDLSSESGSFRVNTVNLRTGQVAPGELIQAGAKVKLPQAPVVWLVKE